MKRRQALPLVLCGLIMAVIATGESYAGRKTAKDPSGITPGESTSLQPVTRQGKPAATARPSKSPTTEASASRKKNHRPMRATKKAVTKAIVQPRTDLTHYGILEDSQRYDPRPHADSTRVSHPQVLDLAHDHFQELDRNQDGVIDPVERAFGRIDMDRDLHSRTLH